MDTIDKILRDTAEKETAMRRIKHDYVNRLSALRLLLADNQISRAMTFLDEIIGDISSTPLGEKLADDAFLNLLLHDTKEKCRDRHIAFSCHAPVGSLPLTDLGVCDLYENLVNNAIEASAYVDEPAIDISLSVREKWLVFSVRNRYNPKASALGTFKTTSKSDTQNHGIGLTTAEKSVSACEGAKLQIEWNADECTVIASAIFPKA